MNIDDVINDPKQYALDFIELEFAKMVPKFLEAYKLGNKFGKKKVYLIQEPPNLPTLKDKIFANIQFKKSNVIKKIS